MIKVNLLKDHTVPVENAQQHIAVSGMSRSVYAYIAVAIVVIAVLGYVWNSSGNAIKKATVENQRLEKELKEMEALRRQFVELEQKKKERQAKVDIIEKLLESQKGPVKLMNVIIQSIPQSRDIWLTSLEQSATGVKVKGQTRFPDMVPAFMDNLTESGIFASVDIEQVERRDEISNFSILCASKR